MSQHAAVFERRPPSTPPAPGLYTHTRALYDRGAVTSCGRGCDRARCEGHIGREGRTGRSTDTILCGHRFPRDIPVFPGVQRHAQVAEAGLASLARHMIAAIDLRDGDAATGAALRSLLHQFFGGFVLLEPLVVLALIVLRARQVRMPRHVVRVALLEPAGVAGDDGRVVAARVDLPRVALGIEAAAVLLQCSQKLARQPPLECLRLFGGAEEPNFAGRELGRAIRTRWENPFLAGESLGKEVAHAVAATSGRVVAGGSQLRRKVRRPHGLQTDRAFDLWLW